MAQSKRKFREIQERIKEITKRPPSARQLEDLKETFVRIERRENETVEEHRPEIGSTKKIARDSEAGL